MSSTDNPYLLFGPGAHVVNHNGTLYYFNDSEAQAFEILLKAWQSGLPARKGSDILDVLDLGSAFRLQQVFKHKATRPKRKWVNPAWGTLIIRTPELRGFYQLNLEPGTSVGGVTEEEPSTPPPLVRSRKRWRKRLAHTSCNGSM